ncbi:MAG: Fe-S oxidoreductase [Pirellulaceae bacterium]|nr:MAG: Fe-S oxidoreductase [Pirellulaceae bacterium]
MWTATDGVRLHVVVSQGQSHNPQKRRLEEELAEQAARLPGVAVAVVPHLYDLAYDGPVFRQLRAVTGPLAVFAWMYERATRWILDRNGVRGQEGLTELKNQEDPDDELDDEEWGDEPDRSTEDEKPRVIHDRPPPARPIYCFDLRLRDEPAAFVAELERIIGQLPPASYAVASQDSSESPHTSPSAAMPLLSWLEGTPRADQLERYLQPAEQPTPGLVQRLEEAAQRRWYPVIDYSRCTNCMECIDFCLFGVYGVDRAQTILVEQPDNCRKGCPACSRVCPENAIIFPQHKTPAIAGAPASVGGLKIDLSKLFGGDPLQLAVQERDEQLLLAGRQAVGMSVGIPKRQANKTAQPADELDKLIDQLDTLEL